jgi:hemolysin activation/secretion protein
MIADVRIEIPLDIRRCTIALNKKMRKITDRLHSGERRVFFLFISILLIGIFFYGEAPAQETWGVEPSGQPGDKLPPLIKKEPLGAQPDLTLPPPAQYKKERSGDLLDASVYVHKIIVTGSTVFSEEQLAEVTAPYEGRKVTMEEIESLRKELSVYYIDRGYITSGAVIPDQVVKEGLIRLHIIEGRLSNIDIEKNKHLRASYYQKRIAQGIDPPLQIQSLQQQLRFLQQNQRIQRINAELKPGVNLGESALDVTVEENSSIQLWTAFDNYISESVGGEQIQIGGRHTSLTGNGDILSFALGSAEGLEPKVDVWYTLPLTARDTTITLRYRKNDFDVVRDLFKDLNIETKTDIYSISLRDPIYRTPNLEIGLEGIAEHKKQTTTLLDMPFSFEPGAINGEVKVSALRFAQDLTYRTTSTVIAARSQFSFGVDALDANIISSDIPDGDFFAWQGQFQWLHRLRPLKQQLFFKAYAQFSADPLVSMEQYAVGGRFTVRGYPENYFVRDNAVVASAEMRIPLVENKPWAEYIHLIPFFDYGWGENTDFPTPPGPKHIYSVGLGLRWTATIHSKIKLKPLFEIFYGYKLKDIDIEEDSLQEEGIHFQFAVSAF